MTGFKKAGNDLDNLLEPWQAGDGFAAATGYKRLGADLNTIYAPAAAGASYQGGTLFKQLGADIGPRFCGKGLRSLPFNGQTFTEESSKAVNIANGVNIATTIKADGTYSVDGFANQHADVLATGTWLPAGQAASDYQVQFAVTETGTYTGGGGTITNGAAAYSACTADRQVKVSVGPSAFDVPDEGGQYTVVINLKRISTGVVQVTTHYYDVHQVNQSQ